MSRDLPRIDGPADLWRLVEGRRSFAGSWPLARFERLADSLTSTDGEVSFELQFDSDELGNRFVELTLAAELMLQCQRSLQPFAFPVKRMQRLGLIETEQDEAGLPDGYEPLLLTEQAVQLADLLEDELILSLPVVPLNPAEPEREWQFGEAPAAAPGPFAELAKLRSGRDAG